MSRFAVTIVGAALSMALVSPASAGGPSVLYAADKAIWRVPGKGKGKPEKVIELSVAASKVSRIEKQPNSNYVLLEIDSIVSVAKLGNKAASPRPLDCASHARLSPDGLCVGCLDGEGRLVIHVLATGKKRLHSKVKPTDFGFASRTKLAVARTRSISIVSIAKGKHLQKAAAFAPKSHLLVSPSGERAVGAFENGEDKSTMYGFKLDGKAAKRKLGTGGVPTGWSRDSEWVITQDGDRTCVIRATGGQYKCWNGYTGQSLSPDGNSFLLAQKSGKKHKLFKVSMAGARPATPIAWKTVESPAAIWID